MSTQELYLYNAVSFILLSFLAHKIFTFYIQGVLKFKCPNSSRHSTQNILQSSSDFRLLNPLTPNDHYRGRTAPLTSKRCILYIYSTNVGTEYFNPSIYSPFFSSLQNAVFFHNSNLFGSCIISHFIYLFNKYRYRIF